MKRASLLWLLPVIVACQTLTGQDVPATLRAENLAYRTEAAALPATTIAEATQVAATVQAQSTSAAELSSVNLQLVATVRAGSTPTQAVVPGVVGEAAADMREEGVEPNLSVMSDVTQEVSEDAMRDEPVTGSGMRFVEVTTTGSVRRSDGCAAGTQTRFPSDVERIYVAARAMNVQRGMVMEVEWYNESRMLLRESWTIPVNAADYCLWFVVSPDDVTFVPGSWTARLYANGQPVGQEANFTILP